MTGKLPSNMPFGGETKPSQQSQKIGLKKVGSSSMFDEMPKKQTQEEFQQKVEKIQERDSSFKIRASKLVGDFYKAMSDKTLSQNKNQFQREIELELLKDMIKLAQDVNSDVSEREGEGSLALITVLLKTCFGQRDRINNLEYQFSEIHKKFSELDKQKKSE